MPNLVIENSDRFHRLFILSLWVIVFLKWVLVGQSTRNLSVRALKLVCDLDQSYISASSILVESYRSNVFSRFGRVTLDEHIESTSFPMS